MATPLSRAPLGVLLLVGLLLAGCQEGGLTGPEDFDTASSPDAFAVVLDQQLAADEDTDFLPAEEVAARSGGTVTSITGPTTITEPGIYAVTQDFSTEGDGIVIQANNVYLDLRKHTLTGPGNKEGRGVVVENAHRVLVGRGIFQTFGVGVELLNSSHTAVIAMRIFGGDEFADPANGIPPQIGILLINSDDNRLYRNHAIEVNLGLFVRGPESHNNRIFHNLAQAGENGLLGICYNPAPDTDDPAGPHNDRVVGNILNGFGVGIQVGEGAANNAFLNNRIYYYEAAWEDANGSNTFDGNQTTQLGA